MSRLCRFGPKFLRIHRARWRFPRKDPPPLAPPIGVRCGECGEDLRLFTDGDARYEGFRLERCGELAARSWWACAWRECACAWAPAWTMPEWALDTRTPPSSEPPPGECPETRSVSDARRFCIELLPEVEISEIGLMAEEPAVMGDGPSRFEAEPLVDPLPPR